MPTTGVERGLIATLLVGAIFLVVHHSGRIGGPARIITVSVGGGEEEGGLESLNAAVAGSVILFEAQRQRLQAATGGA